MIDGFVSQRQLSKQIGGLSGRGKGEEIMMEAARGKAAKCIGMRKKEKKKQNKNRQQQGPEVRK